MSKIPLSNTRIDDVVPLSSPDQLLTELPQSEASAETVRFSRGRIADIISGKSNKLLVIVGPCSIHDPKSAMEYAHWLNGQRQKYAGELEIVMRSYLEKPRTTIGWKGIINDPNLDNSFDVNKGLRISRKLLHDITEIGLPVSYELLDVRTPQYISDLISWAAIGARTTESQLHRELVSGVSFPVGFKNGTGGGIQMVIDALVAAKSRHIFIGIDMHGQTAAIKTMGNPDCHIVLRGGKDGPNYGRDSAKNVVNQLSNSNQNTTVMIDCSHANSNKDFRQQPAVCADIARQIEEGNENIRGVMIESNLVEGNQPIGPFEKLVYGQSITDGCSGLDDTAKMLANLASAVNARG